MDADAVLRSTPEGAAGYIFGIFVLLALVAAIVLIVCKLAKRSHKTSYLAASIVSGLLALLSAAGNREATAIVLWLVLAALLYSGYRRASQPK